MCEKEECKEDEKTIISNEKDKLNEKNVIDLRSSITPAPTSLLGQKTRKYDLIDDEIKTFTLDNDLVVKLISNNKGVFVDFRKYYKGYPTKKGIRLIASKFIEVSKMMEPDITQMVPNGYKYSK